MRRAISAAAVAILAATSAIQAGAQDKPVEQPPAPGALRPYAVPQGLLLHPEIFSPLSPLSL